MVNTNTEDDEEDKEEDNVECCLGRPKPQSIDPTYFDDGTNPGTGGLVIASLGDIKYLAWRNPYF